MLLLLLLLMAIISLCLIVNRYRGDARLLHRQEVRPAQPQAGREVRQGGRLGRHFVFIPSAMLSVVTVFRCRVKLSCFEAGFFGVNKKPEVKKMILNFCSFQVFE